VIYDEFTELAGEASAMQVVDGQGGGGECFVRHRWGNLGGVGTWAAAMLTVDEDNIGGAYPRRARALANRLAPVFPLLMMRALDGKDRCLSLEDGAERIGRTAPWIRDHADELPFTSRLG